ncbi:MAG: GNAT family N-acetyltransferase [Candidatus Marinimicrobia bacterium CG08_land_8_20_14_0_20_45_22]|nr:MAG: GNAT family N-acetyltransferase [Candidatus Marinimicrobia bacterium CG08_land_8_20_14_0_20_45_22]
MPEDFHIRIAEPKDADDLIEFNIAMALETENKILPPEIITAGVHNLFANPQYGFYLVAETNDEIAGALMVTTEWSDWRNGLFWWIQSVYVKPKFRRQGIYRKLYEFIKELAAERIDICGFRLYVEKHNVIAQKTYESLGMTETCYRMYEELHSR